MEEKITLLEPLLEKIEAYTKSSLELYKLKAIDKSASIFATLASSAILLFFLSMFTIMVNIGLALWLGTLLGKTYYGFFVIASFYAFVGGVLYQFFKKSIKDKINVSIILQLLK